MVYFVVFHARNRVRAFCGLLLVVVTLLLSRQVLADPRPWTLDRYQHQAWTGKNGAPTGVSSLAQTSDGYLWIGTDHGLYRFDGVHFKRFEGVQGALPPESSVYDLYASKDGGLWISYESGEIGFLKDGHVAHYGAKAGLPKHGIIEGFAEDNRGAIWLYGLGYLYTRVGERWESMGGDLGLKGRYATFLYIARDGAFWVGTGTGLFYRAANAKQFVPLEQEGYVSDIVPASDGSIWVAHLRGAIERWTTHAVMPVRAPGHIATTSVGQIKFDPQGGLWINGLGDGVRHVESNAIGQQMDLSALSASIELFNSSNGLSGDYAWPLLIDREGNTWVGTGAGVDRFSRSNFTPAPFPPGTHDFALAAGADGAIWTGSSSKPVMELKGSQIKTFDIAPFTLAAYRDREGGVYIGGSSGIWKMSDAGAEHLTTVPKSGDGNMVMAMTKDLHGTLWVSISGSGPTKGLFTWSDGQWKKSSISGTPRTALTDADGRIWLGFRENRIVIADGDNVTTLGPQQGVMIGDAKALQQNGRHVWIGGSDGLGYSDGHRLNMVGLADGGSFKNVTGLVFSTQGDLWVHTLESVFQLPANEVHQVEMNPSYPMHFRKFDTLDGLPGSPALEEPLPSAIRSADGRIWFATSNGVVWCDPAQLISNPLPPQVAIDAIEADGKTYTPQDGLVLPAHTKNLRITFSVLSLTMPERVPAKIRMRGMDNDWRDVGLQREIVYSNLGPGHYRFDVIGANENGIWNNAGAHFEFRITPAFYQTFWFKVLCVCLAALALWQAIAFRVRQVKRRLRVRLETRHAERERIARDLHDTLLQSFPALLLKMQAGVDRLPEDAAERKYLNQTLDQAREVIVEGRDQVARLRSEESGNLTEVLSAFSTEHANRVRMTLNVSVKGRERRLKKEIFEEASFILKEAMINAYKHSGGNLLSVRLDYRSDALLLEVQDNGKGIDAAILDTGEKPGHWGLVGMRERARQISAKLSIESQPDKGTLVTLRIPGRFAYAMSPKASRFFWSTRDTAD
ncbi:sensor histidine kinase [Dyella acidisoli]|uniref:Histidine kinase n=1 Tax=Dyella acidisoli TaxID=1867834 RepID=A0ABQ5XI83_9GAMM|nr:sensor histidine kinase [Dyella acidisoli]GLQ91062.1 histidine kinase [Dyella acidisoli]